MEGKAMDYDLLKIITKLNEKPFEEETAGRKKQAEIQKRNANWREPRRPCEATLG